MNASSILEGKGFCVRSIGPDATVFEALQLMDEHKVGALMVVEKDLLTGVISERHCARRGAHPDGGCPARGNRQLYD